MEIVKDAALRLVTFSKRRNGLFKKANKLAILCSAELTFVVFSPGGKPFSFGHPFINAVTQSFLRHLQDKDDGDEDEEAKSPACGTSSSSGSKKACPKGEKLNKRLMNLTKELEEEKKKGAILDQAIEEKKQEYGLGPGIEAIAGESKGRGEAEEERNGGNVIFAGTYRETGSEKLNLAVYLEKSPFEGSRKWRFQRPILESRGAPKGNFLVKEGKTYCRILSTVGFVSNINYRQDCPRNSVGNF